MKKLYLLPIICCLFFSTVIHAQWATQQNDDDTIRHLNSFAEKVSSVSDGKGGVIVLWNDRRTTGKSSVYAQRIDKDGYIKWTVNGVIANDTIQQGQAVNAIADGNGGVIFGWLPLTNSSALFQKLKVQRIDSLGKMKWGTGGKLVTDSIYFAGQSENLYSLCSDAAGGAYIVFSSYFGYKGGYTGQIGMQHYKSSGAASLINRGVVVSGLNGFCSSPKILREPSGKIYIAYVAGNDLLVNRVTSAGAYSWANTDSTGGFRTTSKFFDQPLFDVAPDFAGGMLITWANYQAGNGDLFVQRFSSGGSKKFSDTGKVVCNAANLQYQPTMIVTSDSNYVIGWYDSRSFDNYYAQKITVAGAVKWATNGIKITPNYIGLYYAPKICKDNNGGAYFGWQISTNVYAQHINSSGGFVCSSTPTQINSDLHHTYDLGDISLVSDQNGNAIFSFAQALGLDGFANIWAKRLKTDCSYGLIARSNTAAATVINKNNTTTAISVYPNPNNGNFTINLPTAMHSLAQLLVFNMQGQLVYTQNISGNVSNVPIHASKLANGTYIIEVKDASSAAKTMMQVIR